MHHSGRVGLTSFALAAIFGFTLAMLLTACGSDTLAPLVYDGLPRTPGVGINDPDRPQGTNEHPDDYIERVCGNLVGTSTQTFDIVFDDPGYDCLWGQAGNSPTRDKYVTARIEQPEGLSLPQGHVVCALDFSFERQRFRYDDHILVHFNDILILSSFDFSPQLSVGDQQVYDWNKIRDMKWLDIFPPRDNIYCPGTTQGNSSCSFPETEEFGNIELDIHPSVIQNIMARDVDRFEHTMTWVTTGDDNPGTDCSHEPVRLELIITFI